MHLASVTAVQTASFHAPATTAAPIFARKATSTLDAQVCVASSDNLYAGGYSCDVGSTCSNIDSRYFGCCDKSSCKNIWRTCYNSGAAPPSCSSQSDCLECNEGTVYTECETWRLFTDSDGLDALTHYFCEISSASSNVFGPWPTPRPESSTSSYSCVASSFSSPHEGDCASPIGIILPLILSNVVYFAINALAGNFKFQIRCQFWKSSRDLVRPEDYIWTPWPGLGSAVLVVVQAAVTAYLVRAGGYGASFKDLMLLWLVRPRMMWSQLLFYVGFGRNYKGSATDALFADTILNIFSIPVLATAITAALKYKGICDADGMVGQTFEGYTKDGLTVLRAFGSDDDAYYLSVYTYFYLAMSGLGIFCLAFFLYKRRLGRWWTIAPLFWSVATFIASWLYWTRFVQLTEGVFCLRNIAAVSVIHAVFPLASTLIRVVLSTWSYEMNNRYK